MMLGEQVLRELLVEIEKDERLYYEVALVQINAPLALEQVANKTRAQLLRKILELPHKQYHGRDEVDPREEDVLSGSGKAPLHEIPLPSLYHCMCKRFYVMPYLKKPNEMEWQVKDFIGGGCCVYLHKTFEDAMKRVSECECCQENVA